MKIKRGKLWIFSLWRLPNQVFFSPRRAAVVRIAKPETPWPRVRRGPYGARNGLAERGKIPPAPEWISGNGYQVMEDFPTSYTGVSA
ncbi:MAG: hypothetical protein ABSG35_05795 [Syntrophobacteraceae bacterium]|jgi:hypothetical protein